MIKKTIATALVLVSLLGSTTAFGATKLAEPIKGQIMIAVIVNGNKVLFPDTEPYLDENSRTLVPVRFVSQSLGAEVKWDDKTRTATITYNSKVIVIPLNSKEVTVDGTAITLDTAAVLSEGRTMVPLRFVSEAMDAEVIWDGDAHYVGVSDKAFLAKVESGEITLDPWGRMLAPKPAPALSAKWNVLNDVPAYAYSLPVADNDSNTFDNKTYFSGFMIKEYTDKVGLDKMSNVIRNYYLTVLNVDYRTIDEKVYGDAVKSLIATNSIKHDDSVNNNVKRYVKFVKDNHIITRGYADPESYMTRMKSNKPVIRTHFKFMVIQSDDKTQTVLDSFDVGSSDELALKKNVWYTGYADVYLYTYSDSHQTDNMGLYPNLENMFSKGRYVYKVLA